MILLVGACAATLGVVSVHRSRRPATADLARRLPIREDSVVLHLDIAAIRAAGLLDLLAGAPAEAEEDYSAFVSETGFDYRTDLDTILGAFRPQETHLVLRGRFDWEKLNSYARRRGGSCLNGFCHLPATAPDRYVSFFAIRPEVLAVAVARGKYGADQLGEPAAAADWMPADRPFWVLVPSARLADSPLLPAGTRSFVSAVREGGRVLLSLGPSGDRLQAELEVTCRRPDDAARIVAELEGATETLRRLIAREKKSPNPRDLSGVLTAGKFSHDGPRVRGSWPIERAFLETVAGGGQ